MAGLDFARRRLLSMGGLALGSLSGALGVAGCANRPTMPSPPELNQGAASMAVVAQPPHARDEWTRLAAGNARFAAGKASHERQDDPDYRRSQRDGAEPYACVLTCMDSRVAPELLFDAGLGDLVTVRTAGGSVDDVVVGSVELAVTRLDVRLVLVLGHSDCATVRAAIARVREERDDRLDDDRDQIGNRGGTGRHEGRTNMDVITKQIGYSIKKIPHVDDREVYTAKCVAMQAVDAAERLRVRSDLLGEAARRDGDDRVSIVPAVYDIGTGLVQRVTESRVLRR